jgi:2-polyprenyl-3-methyl-5-hydroxy-6-metoxy-1,4-benzoquinol methylase
MLPTPEMASTPWRHGPFKAQLHQLSFGQTYEDSGIELQAFKPRSRVFCIAGAGCTARALAAAGHHVTAVDINPLQLGYASRILGPPTRHTSLARCRGYAARTAPARHMLCKPVH